MNKDELIKKLETMAEDEGRRHDATKDRWHDGRRNGLMVGASSVALLENSAPVLQWQTGPPPLDRPILYQAGFSGPHRVAAFITDECNVTRWVLLSDILALIHPPEEPRGFRVTVDCLPLDDQVCDPKCDNLVWMGSSHAYPRCSLFKVTLKMGMEAVRCADCISAEEKTSKGARRMTREEMIKHLERQEKDADIRAEDSSIPKHRSDFLRGLANGYYNARILADRLEDHVGVSFGPAYREILRQEYAGNSCVFSAGFVEGEGKPPEDTIYIRLEKDGAEPTEVLLRPDEAQCLAWLASGVVWSHLMEEKRAKEQDE